MPAYTDVHEFYCVEKIVLHHLIFYLVYFTRWFIGSQWRRQGGGQMPPQNYFLPPPPVFDNFCRNH